MRKQLELSILDTTTLLYSLVHHRFVSDFLSELSISNLWPGNYSQSLASSTSLSAGNADTFNLLKSFVEGELGSMMLGLDFVHCLL
jgi:hypothetical protein